MFCWRDEYKLSVLLILAETNECKSDPCQNGAMCDDKFNSYTCTCAPGYTGYNCETGAFKLWDS